MALVLKVKNSPTVRVLLALLVLMHMLTDDSKTETETIREATSAPPGQAPQSICAEQPVI